MEYIIQIEILILAVGILYNAYNLNRCLDLVSRSISLICKIKEE